MNELEFFTPQSIELVRSETSEAQYLSGYFVKWYDGTPATEYKQGDVYERIAPTALDTLLRSNPPVEVWYEHDNTVTLGSTEDGNVSIHTDNIGAYHLTRFDPHDPDHTKTLAKIKNKWIRGMSFRANGKQKLTRDGNKWISTITQFDRLAEISYCRKPCYKGTSAFVRSEIDRYQKTQELIERLKHR